MNNLALTQNVCQKRILTAPAARFERFQKEAIQGLYAGKSLTGENGIFAPLLKHFLESALEGELSAHLLEEKAKDAPLKNRRNGKVTKQIKSLSGEFDLQTPRDRSGTFDPQVVGKRQVIITEGLEEKRTPRGLLHSTEWAIALEIFLLTFRRSMAWNSLQPNFRR